MSLVTASITVVLMACDACKLGLTDGEQQAMRYTIYMLLGCLYTLMTAIAIYVVRMMRREARQEAERRRTGAPATVSPLDAPAPAGSAR
jgi:uncharacterized iron-regulated membrane protein